MDVIGKPFTNELGHRPQHVAEIIGLKEAKIITAEGVVKIVVISPLKSEPRRIYVTARRGMVSGTCNRIFLINDGAGCGYTG